MCINGKILIIFEISFQVFGEGKAQKSKNENGRRREAIKFEAGEGK